MLKIIEQLTPLNRAVCSRGYDEAVRFLEGILPFRTLTVPASQEHNGWVIPPSWDVRQATICRDGKVVYDGRWHPMAVIALSRSFSGRVDRETLRAHLHFDHRYEDSIPFHYRQQFRSWERDWGFCVPKTLYDSLAPGDYDVDIQTEEGPGELKILEYRHPGRLGFDFVLGGNLDHQGVANDGVAGCAVGIEVLRRLRGRETKFGYRLVLSPGIIGSEYYLAKVGAADRERILEGVFLEMLGARSPLAVQESRQDLVSIGFALKASLDANGARYRTGAFQEIIVNDEYVWENYGIPMVSFSRFPYPEYHSSRDNLGAVSAPALDEAAEALMGMIDRLESSAMIMKRFEGNMCLANPRYGLYMDYGQVALGDAITTHRKRMRYLMDLVPALRRPVTSQAIAAKVGVREEEALEYLRKWQSKGLLDIQ